MPKKKKGGASGGGGGSGDATSTAAAPPEPLVSAQETIDPFADGGMTDDLLAALDAHDAVAHPAASSSSRRAPPSQPKKPPPPAAIASSAHPEDDNDDDDDVDAPDRNPGQTQNNGSVRRSRSLLSKHGSLRGLLGSRNGRVGQEDEDEEVSAPANGSASGSKDVGGADDETSEGVQGDTNGASRTGTRSTPGGALGALGLGSMRKKKPSRQQARKERKAAEVAAVRAQAEEEVRSGASGPNEAERERQGMRDLCDALKVDMIEINPDGHCLYAAVADQLNILGKLPSQVSYQDTRRATAEHMRSHVEDFLPFISDSDESMAGIKNPEAGTGAGVDEDGTKGGSSGGADGGRGGGGGGAGNGDGGTAVVDAQRRHYLDYCDAVEKTGVWGGHAEILALSRAYRVPIHVVQVGTPTVLKVGQDEVGQDNDGDDDAADGKRASARDKKGAAVKATPSSSSPLRIAYLRRMYGLGEHYNSLRPRSSTTSSAR